jgi:type VI secretion system Hcp family effector
MALDAAIYATGAKQGVFKGSNPFKTRPNSSIVSQVTHLIDIPKDPASGLSLGKRVHHPLNVIIPLDAASVQWWTAAVNNETLTKVKVDFFQPVTQGLTQNQAAGSGGEAKAHFTIELTNAVVSSIELYHPDTRSQDPDIKHREITIKLSLTYATIDSTWANGGLVFHDAWTEGSQ